MRILRTAVVLSIILAVLCASLAAQSNRPIYLFSLEGNGSGTPPLHVFRVNSTTGALSEVPNSPFATGPGSCCIVVDPTSRFVYVANSDSNNITAYSLDASTGTLTRVPGSPYLTGNNAVAIAIDPTGRFLYVSSFTASGPQPFNVYGYSIDSTTGVLTPLAGSPFPQSNFISSITFDPEGNHVFLAQPQANPLAILIDSVNFTSGAFTKIGSFLGSQNMVNWTAMDPSGNFLYGADASSAPGRVGVFSFDAVHESLSEIQASPYVLVPAIPTTGPILGASDLVIAPSGKFIYAVNQNYSYQTTNPPSEYNGSISAFSIDPGTGALTPVNGSPFSAGINPLSMVVDPTGHFAYASPTTYTTGYLGYATVLGFSIDSLTGALTPFSSPAWIDTLQYSTGYRLAISYGSSGTSNPVPMISSLAPSSATAGGAGFTLQVNGVNFVPGAAVYFGGQARATTYVTSTQLTADILSADIANGGAAVLFVFNPLPGGGASTSAGFTIFNPSPTISSISPSSVVAGGAGFTLTVNGSNFVTGSVVNFNGAARSATYISSTQLSIAILAGDITNQGTINITVTNLANGVAGGGTSGPAPLTVLPASIQPIVSGLSPASAMAGGPAFTLTVTGSGFTTASQVSFNLNNVPTTYMSTTQLLAAIPASAIALAGNPVVTVTYPGGISLLATFVVNNPVPMISSLSPFSVTAGGAGFTLQVNGVNFVPGTAVYFGGKTRATTYVTSTQLTADILSADIANGGAAVVFVFNPLPGGGASTSAGFTIFNPSPTISSISPSSVAAGGAGFTLTVNGSNFVTGSVVNFNGVARSATYISSTQLSIAISAGDITNQGTINITVTNLANGVAGGGTSGPAPLTVLPASIQPIVSGLSPASAMAGGPGFTLTVTGSGFTTASQVRFNLNNVPTTYMSTTQLLAAIPASAIALAGNPVVTVTNPGQSISLLATFTVTDYSVNALNATTSVTAGQTATFDLTVSPFPNSVTFMVSGLPTTGATATFSPATISPSTQAAVKLSISTTARSFAPSWKSPRGFREGLPSLYLIVVVFGVMCLGLRTSIIRVRRLAPQLLLASVLVTAAGLAACGGAAGGTSSVQQVNPATGTPAGTYPILITATSGGVARTTTVTLIVM